MDIFQTVENRKKKQRAVFCIPSCLVLWILAKLRSECISNYSFARTRRINYFTLESLEYLYSQNGHVHVSYHSKRFHCTNSLPACTMVQLGETPCTPKLDSKSFDIKQSTTERNLSNSYHYNRAPWSELYRTIDKPVYRSCEQ